MGCGASHGPDCPSPGEPFGGLVVPEVVVVLGRPPGAPRRGRKPVEEWLPATREPLLCSSPRGQAVVVQDAARGLRRCASAPVVSSRVEAVALVAHAALEVDDPRFPPDASFSSAAPYRTPRGSPASFNKNSTELSFTLISDAPLAHPKRDRRGSETSRASRVTVVDPLMARMGSVVGMGGRKYSVMSMASSISSVAPSRSARGALIRPEEAGDVEDLIEEVMCMRASALDLCELGLTALPDSLCLVADVVEALLCSRNELSALPRLLCEFDKLQTLKASNNELSEVPDELGGLVELVELDLSYNELSALPDTFRGLVKLRILAVDFNAFVEVPPAVLGLPALQSLCIAENHDLRTLPPASAFANVPAQLEVFIDNQPSILAQYKAPGAGYPELFTWNKIFPDEILPHVYLGSLRCAQTPLVYRELGIKYVVTCGRNMTVNTEGVERLELEVEDVEEQSLVPYFNRFLEFMAAKKGTGNVLVHCFAGLSRSVTMVLCYLVKEHGMRLDDAMAHVMKVRPNVHPNKTFMRELISYDRAVHGEDARPLDMEHLGDKRTERRLQMMKKRSLQGGN